MFSEFSFHKKHLVWYEIFQGDIEGTYNNIDKETPISTDRQVRVLCFIIFLL